MGCTLQRQALELVETSQKYEDDFVQIVCWKHNLQILEAKVRA